MEVIEEPEIDLLTQQILLASSNHDLTTLKPLLRTPGSSSVQDPETAFTPLHAAIAACGPVASSKDPTLTDLQAPNSKNGVLNPQNNGVEVTHVEAGGEEVVDMERAKETVRELFLAGAIWNDLDMNNETPGCLAWRLGRMELYELCVEAGVRAELLMNLMGGYERLEDEEEAEEGKTEEKEVYEDTGNTAENTESKTSEVQSKEEEPPTHPPLDHRPPHSDEEVNSTTYLNSSLTLTPQSLLDSSANGVMMSWETDIMSLSSSLLAPTAGLRILNIGFGMGIIDRFFASTHPAAHHIIEAHPDVLARLKTDPEFGPESEWGRKEENIIHAGKWQDILPSLLDSGEMFDAIYFDTFGEDYSQLKLFFSEYVVALLNEEGRFGFFNGLGADRRVCYDVYCRVVELDLMDAGFAVDWRDVDVKELGGEGEGEWEGVRRRYWTLEKYRLPICRFMG